MSPGQGQYANKETISHCAGEMIHPALSMGAFAEAFLPVQVTRSTCLLPGLDTEALETLELALPSLLQQLVHLYIFSF